MTDIITPAYDKRTFSDDEYCETYTVPTSCPECYVRVDYWTALEHKPVINVALVSTHWNPMIWESWAYRIKAALQCLRGEWTGYEISLLNRASVQAMVDVLNVAKEKMQ